MLSDCVKIGVSISEILRFILINKINSCGSLYTRYLLYQKMGEITLSGYIYICMHRPSMDMVVRGLKDSDMNDPQFELGATLAEASRPVALNHPHCAKFCVLGGAACSR